jgi:hypothetical protein
MDISSIVSLIAAPLDLVKTLGLAIIDLIGRGHPDETKLAELKNQYDLAVKNLDFSIKQAELWIKEKMMVGSKAQYPLTMISGISIIFVCLFNMIVRSLGWGIIDIYNPEMILLIALFLFVTSGSDELFVKITLWLISKIPNKSNTTTDNKDKKINS